MTDITVVSRAQHIIVDPISKSVSVINAGPQGPQGPAGVGGTAAGTLVTDAGDWFVTSNVEDVLQEIGASLDVRDNTIVDHETRIVTAEAKIVDNDQRISAVEQKSNDNESDVSNLASGVSANASAIQANASAIQANDSNIAAVDSSLSSSLVTLNSIVYQLDSLSTRVDELESAVPAAPGGSILNGWWSYNSSTTGPATEGQIRISSTFSGIGSTGTIWINSVDDQGLDWSLVTVQVGDTFVLRSTTGETWILSVDTVVTTGEFGVELISATTQEPKKNEKAQVSLVRNS